MQTCYCPIICTNKQGSIRSTINKTENKFSNFSCMCLNPNIFFPIWILIVLIYEILETFKLKNLFWLFTYWINCSSDLKNFENSLPSASNFKTFSGSLEQFLLTELWISVTKHHLHLKRIQQLKMVPAQTSQFLDLYILPLSIYRRK